MNGVFKVMEYTVAMSHLMTWLRHGVSAWRFLRRAEILCRRGIHDPIRFHVGSCVFLVLLLLIVSPLIVLSLTILPLAINYVAYRTRSISTKRSPHCQCPSVTLMFIQDTQHLHQAIPSLSMPFRYSHVHTGHASSPPSDPLIVNALPLLSCCLQDKQHLHQAIPSLSMPFRYSHVAYRTRTISSKRSPHCHCPSVTLMLPTGHAPSPPSDPLIVIALPLLSCCLQDTQHLHQAIP